MQRQRRTVTTPVGDLAVAEAGRGGRPLLLVHGFTGAKEDFTDWLGPLADRGWHAVAMDLRGHGESPKPPSEADYSLAAFAADVVDLADALGWHRFALLGHSMGGMVAQVVALGHPGRVAGLVLMDTGHGPVEGVEPALAEMAIAYVREHGMDAFVELVATMQGPLTTEADRRVRAERPGYVEMSEAKVRASSPAMYAAMAAEMLAQDDRLEALAGLDVPTLVVVGEQDTTFLGPSDRMAAAIPGAELLVVAGAGHSPQFEAPDAWWGGVAAFLERAAVAEVA